MPANTFVDSMIPSSKGLNSVIWSTFDPPSAVGEIEGVESKPAVENVCACATVYLVVASIAPEGVVPRIADQHVAEAAAVHRLHVDDGVAGGAPPFAFDPLT